MTSPIDAQTYINRAKNLLASIPDATVDSMTPAQKLTAAQALSNLAFAQAVVEMKKPVMTMTRLLELAEAGYASSGIEVPPDDTNQE